MPLKTNDRPDFYANRLTPSHPGGPSPTEQGWVYLAYDLYKLWQTKIGHTTLSIWDRINSITEDPHYVLYAAWRVPYHSHAEIKDIEEWLRAKVSPIRDAHVNNGQYSEFVNTPPDDAMSIIIGKIQNVLPEIESVDGECDFTSHLYLPEVWPYHLDLNMSKWNSDRLARLVAPAQYYDNLVYERNAGKQITVEEQKFIENVDTVDTRPYRNFRGPEILVNWMRFYLARRISDGSFMPNGGGNFSR